MSKKREAEQQKHDRRRQAPLLRRAAPTRQERPVLLILCQGTVTEVEYFKGFELATATIVPVGFAYDPELLVRTAVEMRKQAEKDRQPYEQVWCVFDKDDTEAGPFQAAIARAEALGLQVAYSNQAFEFWFLLHFTDHPGGGMNRKLCGQRLEELIKAANPRVSYDSRKGKHVSRDLFDLLEAAHPGAGSRSRREMAVRRAKTIADRWEAEGTPPAQQESTTLVYRLVEVLQQHLTPPVS